MRFCLSLCIVLLLSGNINAQQDTTWFDKYWEKTTKRTAFYYRPQPEKKGELYLIRDYYLDGTLQFEGLGDTPESSSVFDGECRWYFGNGNLSSVKTYRNGDLEGRLTEYYPNGKICFQVEYVNDKKQGKYLAYYSNGKTKITGSFHQGVAKGTWTYYSMDGQQTGTVVYP